MKLQFYAIILIFLAGSCQKQPETVHPAERIRQQLKSAVAADDYHRINFENAVFFPVDSQGSGYLKIPLEGKKLDEFMLLKIKEGQMQDGRFVSLNGSATYSGRQISWNGFVRISNLERKLLLASKVNKGFIAAYHPDKGGKMENIVPVYPDNRLPEVVVVAYVSNGSNSIYNWLLLESMFWNSNSGGNYSSYYGSMDGSSGGYYDPGGGGYSYSGGWQPAPVIQVDYENQADREGIDLQRYITCFNAIPDAGATCSIAIFADIPVDADPNILFDFSSGSPGHTFLQIRKSNGGQSVSQNIGFYPREGWKAFLTTAPVESKLVDNGQHEFNASFTMDLSPAHLNSVLTELLYLKNRAYDIDNYNCTDWALAVFNKVRTDPLEIPLYNLPGSTGAGTSTPQGLFNKLKEMKSSGHPEAAKIDLGFYKSWVGNSTGPCN